MKLSRIFYFGDFVAIPIAVAAMVAFAIVRSGASAALPLALSFASGLLGWTLVEYFIHRVVYHRIPIFSQFHDAHHANPDAFLGFPSFVSSGLIIAAIFLPAYDLNLTIACGLTSGMLVGYGYYMLVHHATHHFVIRPAPFFTEHECGIWRTTTMMRVTLASRQACGTTFSAPVLGATFNLGESHECARARALQRISDGITGRRRKATRGD